MGYCLDMSTGDMREVVRLLTAVERTADQERRLGLIREQCMQTDLRLREQGIAFGVSVARALEELIDGVFSTNVCPAYMYAFRHVVASHFSDITDLGVWRQPSWFFALGDELARYGVPVDLLPGTFLFSGPPLRLPHPGDAFPQIGIFPAQRAAELAGSYEAVVHRLSPDYRDTAARFAELMRFEADEWEGAQKMGRTPDTIFFWFR
ncbi:DUF7691 family protein [Streptomyces bluensis]|uniref:DUF7691 family protein n=1 Tax=Streptomyces bluensis TaxID=33897 RepID=UPI003687D1A4